MHNSGIKVAGCGLCHTHIAIISTTKAQLEEWHATPPRFTTGHEIAGWVAEAGPSVIGIKTCEPVAVGLFGVAAATVLLTAPARRTSATTCQASLARASDSTRA